MELTKQFLPLALTIFLVGCNLTETTDDKEGDDESPGSGDLALAKSFVQDFAGLQTSLMQLQTPAEAFAAQVEADIASADQSDAEALARTFEAIAAQLSIHWDAMAQDNGSGGLEWVFTNVPTTAFDDDIDAGVDFSDASSYSLTDMTDTGRTLASGTAEVDMGGGHFETVAFDLTLDLPAFDGSDTGDVSYDVNVSLSFTTDTLTLNATNVGGTLNLALGNGTVDESIQYEVIESQIDSLELTLESLTLEIGALTFSGEASLSLTTLTLDGNDIESPAEVDFSVTGEGRLTSSNGSYLDSSMSLGLEFNDTYTLTPEDTDLYETSANLNYAFTTRLVSGGHDFDVTATGDLLANNVTEEDYFAGTWSDQIDFSVEGALTITHNGAQFKVDYDVDYSESSSQNSDSQTYDLILQDGTVTTATVIIVVGDFDNAQTPAVEFGIVKVNGTKYGTLFNDQGVTKASFTDGSSVVVFDGY